MEGAVSAYKHYTHKNNFSQYSQFNLEDNWDEATQIDWRVLPNTICMNWDLHRSQFMQPASSINECIAQC